MSKVASGVCYVWEKNGYMIILVSYVIFKINIAQFGMCLAHLLNPFTLFIVVLANEALVNKVNN